MKEKIGDFRKFFLLIFHRIFVLIIFKYMEIIGQIQMKKGTEVPFLKFQIHNQIDQCYRFGSRIEKTKSTGVKVRGPDSPSSYSTSVLRYNSS